MNTGGSASQFNLCFNVARSAHIPSYNKHTLVIIISSGSTVLVRTLAALHGRFVIYFRHLIGLLWTSDQPVAKASTYTGQHNTETRGEISVPQARFDPRRQTSMRSVIRTCDPTNQAAYALDRAATWIGIHW
jgi:hypothetical protein